MPTATVTHTLEGPDLEALLARVPAELGPDATIVAANKLRKGGVAGFFAKEAFEVVVEVPLTSSDAPAAGARGAVLAPGPAAAASGVPVVEPPRVSTEAIGFAGVLDRMVRDAGISDSGPRAVGPALTRPAPIVDPPLDAPATAPTATTSVDAVDPREEPATPEEPFEPLVPARVPRSLLVPAPDEQAPAVERAPIADRPVHDPAAVLPRAALVDAPSPAATMPARGPEVPQPAPVVVAELDVPGGALDERWLERVGLPVAVAEHLSPATEDPATTLARLMQHIVGPDPLPTRPGSVIAVVGRRAEALEVSAQLAAELGVGPEEVLVAATSFRGTSVAEERRVNSIDLALERRRSWRRRKTPTIIAVEAPMGRQGTPWALHLLDAIEPTMVWGVVEAHRKTEDIREWAMRVGGLDALAVTGVEETVSPAAVLGVGVPVGLLDGHAATPARWTAILAEHLEVAA